MELVLDVETLDKVVKASTGDLLEVLEVDKLKVAIQSSHESLPLCEAQLDKAGLELVAKVKAEELVVVASRVKTVEVEELEVELELSESVQTCSVPLCEVQAEYMALELVWEVIVLREELAVAAASGRTLEVCDID